MEEIESAEAGSGCGDGGSPVAIDGTSQIAVPEGHVRFLAINVDGVRPRSPEKITALGSVLAPRRVDVCLITGTQIYDAQAPEMRLPGYEYANHSRREDEVTKIRGGVAIYVRVGLHAEKLNGLPGPALPLVACSKMLRVRDDLIRNLRVTVAHLPFSAKLEMHIAQMFRGPPTKLVEEGEVAGHLLGGDFNNASWPEEFEKWLAGHGI